MLNQAESSRRRELQRRAFAVDGGANDAELAELRELDARAAADAVVAPAAIPTVRDSASAPQQRDHDQPLNEQGLVEHGLIEQGLLDPPQDAPDEHEPSAPAGGAVPRRRRPSIPLLVLSTLIALLLGIGGGWMLLNRDSTPTMSAEQAKAMAEIEKTARFDPGSMTYLGEQYDASLWRATSKNGEEICLAIHVIDRNGHQCMSPTDEDTPFAQPVGVSLNRSDGDVQWSYWATLVTDITGREVLIVQRYDMAAGFDWEAQYTEDERRYIRVLEADGIDPTSLQIIGYDDDVPIFLSQDGSTCILVSDPANDAVAKDCDPSDGVYSLQVDDVRYEMHESNSRGPTLTIIRTPDSTGESGG
ncbi:hypothetical protein [Microbacterium sp.]|uniref:hypothetical protein n=1 Tax=Microbacterium sp. TaxID=51671 RepID=UPI0028AC8E66|nr:hypothetical protein [Microbacterium sp.]